MPESRFLNMSFGIFKDSGVLGEGKEAYNEGFSTVIIFISIKGMYHNSVQNTRSENVQRSVEGPGWGNNSAERCVVKGGLDDCVPDLSGRRVTIH